MSYINFTYWFSSDKSYRITGGGNDELNADGGKSIKLLKIEGE